MNKFINELKQMTKLEWVINSLFIIYLAITPLLYKHDPVEFHLIKLNTMFLVIWTLFTIFIFGYKYFKEDAKLTYKLFKYERWLLIVASIIMLFSLSYNYSEMKSFVRNGLISTNVLYGAGPNFISIFFYLTIFVLIWVSIPMLKYVNQRLILVLTSISLIITGSIIFYEIFIYNFQIEGSRTFLFAFGNSNYTPDAFAVFGLILLLPIFYEEKINYLSFIIGIYFFLVVIISMSRAAYVGLFVAVLFAILFLIVKRKLLVKRTLVLLIVGIIILVVAIYLMYIAGDTAILSDFRSLIGVATGESTLSDASSLRVDLWLASLDKIFNSTSIMLLGNGQSVYIWETSITTYLVTNVHNMYIDVLLSTGITVFIIFALMIYKVLRIGIKITNNNVKNLIFLSAIIYTLVKWLFNSLNGLHSPFVILPFIMIGYAYLMQNKLIEN